MSIGAREFGGRTWAGGGLAAAAFFCLLVGCVRREEVARERPPRPVEVAGARSADVPVYIDEIGTCGAVETVVIQPQVSGRVAEVHFDDGRDVGRGDLLFTIDDRPFRAEVARAEATVAQDRAKLELARERLRRAEKLRKAGTIAPEEFDVAKSGADEAEAQLRADEAALESARINLGYCRIVSPVDGRLGDRMVDAGNIVEENKSRMLVVRRQDPMYVQFTIPEAELPQVRRSMASGALKVLAKVPSEGGGPREGTLDFVDNTVQEDSGTVRLRAVVENGDRHFWPGQFVEVRLILETLRGVTMVPARALQVGQRGPFVFVVQGDQSVELRGVRPGQRQGEDVAILEGVRPGETVVVSGQMGLVPGAKVAVVGSVIPGPAP